MSKARLVSKIVNGERVMVEADFTLNELAAIETEEAAYLLKAAEPSPLSRLVIADRLTDEEVMTVAALQSGRLEQQRLWLRWISATEIDHGDAATVASFEALFGVSRASELLVPEE